MKNKKRRLLELAGIVQQSKLLLEAEDDLFGDDEEEEEGDEEEAADDEEATGDEEEEEKLDEDEEDPEEEEEEEEDPAEELTPTDIAKYGAGEIDDELNNILEDIYVNALERAKVRSVTSIGYPGHIQSLSPDEAVKEGFKKYSLLDRLFEEKADNPPAEEFDIHFYAKEVARYIKNYETLLDMEGMIFNKARQMLLNQFGKETEDEFVELLDKVHDLGFGENNSDPSIAGANQPLATGATAVGG